MDAGEGGEWCVEWNGTVRGRDRRTGTNGGEETERRGNMKVPENVPRWKRRGEPQHLGNDKLDTSFHQTKLFIFFSISSSSLNVDIFQLSCPGSPALCFLSVFDKGDRGGWSSVDPGARLSLMEECCCLLLRTPSQLETHLWAFLSSLPARSKTLPPSEHIYISP